MTNYRQRVFDINGKPQILANQIASGGEGVIYPLQQRLDVLIKCYHPNELKKRGHQLEEKIEAMRQLPSMVTETRLSWPRISVFDEHGAWIGYAMKRVSGIQMHNLAHAMIYNKKFPGITRIDIINYLVNLIDILQNIHKKNIRMGDYNLQNILCEPNTSNVNLIDCDSYQIEISNKLYPCPVGSADLTPPEHHGKSFATLKRTNESEYFSLAIILFKCLMLGRHPYDIVGGADPVTNLKIGNFAYGIGNTGIPPGPWFNIWSHMPHRLKTMFITVFTEGATDPSKRPNLSDWKETLEIYGKEITKGWHKSDVRPSQPKEKGYKGTKPI